MLFYNSILSLPMLLAAVVLKGEPVHMADYPLLWHPTFQLVLLASSALGLTINHSTFVCTRVNEPLMTSVAGACPRGCLACPVGSGQQSNPGMRCQTRRMALPRQLCCPLSSWPPSSFTGNLKNAIMTIVGAFAFGDFIFEPWNATGLAVSMAGAVWYAMRSALRVRHAAIPFTVALGDSWGCAACALW